ncbi:MAG: FHA domain-containing protein [Candidatus Latescibacteria bacterium]|nr:FHA domain-containing protein [Candidatus Latescibacterota bacterium]NIO78662.1 FHA domain-containing protein [Candidatus Latescibacterota bacterium]
MGKTSTDQKFGSLDEKLDEKFDQYQSLTEREKALRDMLRKAEQEKADVPEKIYQKIIRDYAGQLFDIEKELAPIEEKIAELHESTAQDLSSLESDLETLEEQHAEALFRHKVGEYNKEKLEEIEQSIMPQIEEKKSRKEPLAGLLSRIESITSRESRKSHEETSSPETEQETIDTGTPEEEATREPESETPQDEPPLEREAETPQEETTLEPDSKNKLVDDSEDADFISELADPMDEMYEAVQDDSPEAVAVDAPPQEQPTEEIAKEPETRGETTAIAFPNLIITSGSQSGKKIPLLPMTTTIGREHDNNIELKDEEVARYHARVVYDEGNFILQDLNSSTGTWVNGKQISEVILKDSDRIRFGQTEMVIDFS